MVSLEEAPDLAEVVALVVSEEAALVAVVLGGVGKRISKEHGAWGGIFTSPCPMLLAPCILSLLPFN